ncbi:Odorant receptor 58 [Cephus cinctus]|uniref:Odorant receptor n=1 Tax=Cephus cinctus TaxID=211228 RepID=A0A3L9M129_CEPCN|nr:odorant receptor 4 isoform X2 [Cephus cinctus]RLZ02283.1 Odorant receptor 58 [Cephus cinctus]
MTVHSLSPTGNCKGLKEGQASYSWCVRNLRTLMVFTGIWPMEPPTLLLNVSYYYNATTFTLVICGMMAGAISVMDNYDLLVDNLSINLIFTEIFIKCILIKIYSKPLSRVLSLMKFDWISLKGRGPIHGDVLQSENIMLLHANIPRIFFIAYTALALVAWTATVVAAVSRKSSKMQIDASNAFPMPSWYPFEMHSTPNYEMLLTFQVIIGCSIAVSSAAVDSLLVTAVFHVCGQLEILRKYFENLHSSETALEETEKKVAAAIKRHSKLIDLCDLIEDCYSQITLSQLLVASLNVCLSGFGLLLAIESGNIKVFLKFLLLLIAMLQQILIYSVTGDYLSSKSTAIRSAIYKMKWYELPPSLSKALMLIAIRAERPLVVTAGKFFPMSLENFTQIIKTAASYLSVMWAVHKK